MDHKEENPEKESNVFMQWDAPSRPFKRRTSEFYRTAIAISVLISLILIFIGEFLLIGVIAATMWGNRSRYPSLVTARPKIDS